VFVSPPHPSICLSSPPFTFYFSAGKRTNLSPPQLTSLLPLLPELFQIKTLNELHNPSEAELALCDGLFGDEWFPGFVGDDVEGEGVVSFSWWVSPSLLSPFHN
jgi:hypothetical protein